MLVPEFFSEILLEAKAQSEMQTPKMELERKGNKIYEINMQLDALSERLGLLPKSVNPQHVFDQMERLSLQKQSLEDEIKALKASGGVEAEAISIENFEVFRSAIVDMLENEGNSKVKAAIIQKVVEKIVIKKDEVEIYFFVGEKHYKRVHDVSGSCLSLKEAKSEKKHTSPLPVFHGNPETSDLVYLKPKKIYDAGSNSLRIGRE